VLVYRDADASLRTRIVELEASGRKLGIVVSSVRVDGPDNLAPAFAALARQRVRGLMHLYPFVHPFIARNLQTLGQLALEHRIALMANSTLVAGTHELLAYGVNVPALSQPAARLVDRLLRGESPATMPVERAQVFDLVVNLHTAHALGVEVPRSVRRQATRVIEFAKLPRIGILDLGYGIYPALERALLQLGYVNGKNVFYDPRFADGKPERLAVLADELVRDHVDVIVAASHNAAFAARKATNRIPIVVRASHNGVKMGLYSTLARPGGNLTGVDALAPELDAKRAELLKQTVPGLSQLAVLLNPADRSSSVHLKYVHAAAKALAIGVEPLEVASAAELDAVLARAARALPKALLIFTDEVTDASIGHVAEFAIKHAIPTMCEFRHQAQAGCLISYGPSTDEFDAIAARQIDKILKGAKAGDLPVQLVTRYELVINQKVARAVGVTIPRALLAAATAVIE
jgi:putative ABC transport system substrate-binding protein